MKLENKPMFQMWKQKSRLFFSLSLKERERKKKRNRKKIELFWYACTEMYACRKVMGGLYYFRGFQLLFCSNWLCGQEQVILSSYPSLVKSGYCTKLPLKFSTYPPLWDSILEFKNFRNFYIGIQYLKNFPLRWEKLTSVTKTMKIVPQGNQFRGCGKGMSDQDQG